MRHSQDETKSVIVTYKVSHESETWSDGFIISEQNHESSSGKGKFPFTLSAFSEVKDLLSSEARDQRKNNPDVKC